jgi:excisionase family DNA binding protein
MMTSASPATATAKTPVPRREPERLSYTLQEAAAVTGLSVATLRRHEKAGRIAFHKVGGLTLIPATSLRAMVGGQAA